MFSLFRKYTVTSKTSFDETLDLTAEVYARFLIKSNSTGGFSADQEGSVKGGM